MFNPTQSAGSMLSALVIKLNWLLPYSNTTVFVPLEFEM